MPERLRPAVVFLPVAGGMHADGCAVAVLEPLVEAGRPKSKAPPQDLRRTVSALVWRHENGAKRRAIPAAYGAWWRAAQLFIRWSRHGAWERLLALVQERGVKLGLVYLDGTSIRAHQTPSCLKGRAVGVPSQTFLAAGT